MRPSMPPTTGFGLRFERSARRPALLAAVIVLAATALLPADIITPLTSYEASETGLTVTANSGDTGLQVSIVQGGVSGVPAATDGSRVLRVQITGETDKKIEFRHNWSASTYDLAGHDELLADVYIASAGAVPGLMGIWSSNWNPPDAWQAATGIPASVGVWTTVSFNLAGRSQTGLNQIWAFIFENMAGTTGLAYVDNLRFRTATAPPPTGVVAANGYADHVSLVWKAQTAAGLQGYNVYRGTAAAGPFTKLNATLLPTAGYEDATGAGYPRYYYRVTTVVSGQEANLGEVVSALYNGMTDAQMLDLVQEASFRYFWNGAHPNCGLAREGLGMGHSLDTVTTGGTGMGLISIVVAVERGFITRAEAATRVRTILAFLQDTTPRYHGAWSHHYNGVTGATIAFAGYQDNGGDLVETAFLIEGMLTVRRYFDASADPVETEIRTRATQMWESVEWSWYRRYTGGQVLYWHWSPDYGWAMDHQIRGFNEAMIVYLLAIASPTYPMPSVSYYNGWVGAGGYTNGGSYYGHAIWVGPAYGGPLFFTHYSCLGFDPRYQRDPYTNYFENARNIALVHHDYAIDNPAEYAGYSAFAWGLTASFNPWGYAAQSPTSDNGTISPTAALSSMPYTPAESLAALRHFYDVYGASLWGPYGFRDAFNPESNWTAPGYIAIDEGPIAPMIENYRTGRCWALFMSNPEIVPALRAIGFRCEVDFDSDGYVELADWTVFATCTGGPGVGTPPAGCSAARFAGADLDNDGDVDLTDTAIFQRLFTP